MEALGAYGYWKNSSAQWYKSDDREQIYNLLSSDLDTDMLKVFPFEFAEGDPAEFARPMSAIIAESVAELLWPDESPVGKTIVNRYNSSAEYRIVAVYRDFPRNSSVENGVLLQMGDDCLTLWNEWSFQCYMKLHNPDDAGKVAEMLRDKMLEALEIGPDSDMAKMLESGVRITNLHEAYFSRDIPGDNMGKGNRTTTGSLFAIGLILIVIAIINFINMATAAVPLSIKDINTRKGHKYPQSPRFRQGGPHQETACGSTLHRSRGICPECPGAASDFNHIIHLLHIRLAESRGQRPRHPARSGRGGLHLAHRRDFPCNVQYIFPACTGAERLILPV